MSKMTAEQLLKGQSNTPSVGGGFTSKPGFQPYVPEQDENDPSTPAVAQIRQQLEAPKSNRALGFLIGLGNKAFDSEPQMGLPEKALRTAADVTIGAAKGVGFTLAGASALGEKILSAPMRLMGMKTEKPLGQEIQESGKLAPTNTAQKIGFGGEQLAEFLIPGGAVSKTAKVVENTLKLGKAEKVVGVVGKAVEAAKGLGRLGVRGGLEAAALGGQTAIQQGGITPDVKGAAVLGAVSPLIGKALAVGGKVMGFSSEKVINSLIKPLSRDFAFGKNAGRGVASEGIVASNWDDLIGKIQTKRKEIGTEIGETLERSSVPVNLKGVEAPITEALASAKTAPNINSAVITRLEGALADIKGIIRKGNITPKQAFDIKEKVADLTKFTEPLTDAPLNKALKKIYGNIKEKINEAVPGVRSLNERYADIKTAEIASIYRDKIIQRQNYLPLAGKVGGIVAGASIAGLPGALGGAIFTSIGEKALGSVAFKTRIAAILQSMNMAERKAVIKNPLMKRIIERIFGKEPEKVLQNPKAPSSMLKPPVPKADGLDELVSVLGKSDGAELNSMMDSLASLSESQLDDVLAQVKRSPSFTIDDLNSMIDGVASGAKKVPVKSQLSQFGKALK
jgi:hypothetical protein